MYIFKNLFGIKESDKKQTTEKNQATAENKDKAEEAFLNPLTLSGHTGAVRSVSLSQNGNFALSGGEDNTPRFWNLRTGQCVHKLKGHKDWIYSVALSQDGDLALTGSDDNTLRVWNPKSGQCIRTLEGHQGWIFSVVVSNDKNLALSGSKDNTLRLWSLKTWNCIKVLEGHKGYVTSVALDQEGNFALSGSWDKTLRLWDLKTGECVKVLTGHKNNIRSVAFSHYGNFALSGSDDETLRYWLLKTGECIQEFKGHKDQVRCVAFSADGNLAFSGSNDQTLRVWDIMTGKLIKTVKYPSFVGSISVYTHQNQVYALAGLDNGNVSFQPVYNFPEAKAEAEALISILGDKAMPSGHATTVQSNSTSEVPSQTSLQLQTPALAQPKISLIVDSQSQSLPAHDPKPQTQNAQNIPTQTISHSIPSNELKVTQDEIQPKITQEQLQFLSALQTSGVQPESLQQLQKQWGSFPLSHEEIEQYKTLMHDFSSKLKALEIEQAETNKILDKDPQARDEQSYIDNYRDKHGVNILRTYQSRLQRELSAAATCYFLAHVGLFRLEDNKKDSAISFIGSLPIAGQFLKIITSALSFANKKHRIYQINRLGELFKDTSHIAQVCSNFARQLTLAQEDSITQSKLQAYQGFAKVKGFVKEIKAFLAHPGVKYSAEEELAVLDMSFLLEQILSGTVKIDTKQDLPRQFVEVITGSTYQPRVFNQVLATSIPSLNVSLATQDVSITSSGVKVHSTIAAMNVTPGLSMEAVQQLLDERLKHQMEILQKTHEEALRKQREEFEATIQQQQQQVAKAVSREEMDSVQERLAATEQETTNLKKKVLPESEASSGNMAQALINPHERATGITEHQAETTQVLTKHDDQLKLLSDQLSILQDEQRNNAHKLSRLEDKTGLASDKAGLKRIKLVQYENNLDDKKKQEQAKIKEIQKLKEKQQLQNGWV